MIPAAFDYDLAESVEHALELLSDGGGDAKILAGGQSLIPAMKLRLARPTKLVDLGRLDDLAYVRDGGTHVAIGALTRHAAVAGDPILAEHCPIVSATAAQIGDPQVRSRGTLGGTMAHGDPASDMPAVMLALGAEVVARGPAGERVIPATEFFTGVFQTACAPDEVVVEVRVPKLAASTGWSYVKAQRRAQDWATVAVAALVHRDDGSVPSSAFSAAVAGSAPPESASSTAFARSGVPPMLTRPTRAPPSTATAATATVAQSCARRANLMYDHPAPFSFGTRISVRTSCGPRAVSKTPVKKSEAGIRRSPPGPVATNSAPSVSSTPGMSEAGSPCATEPPIVPRWRTCGSPTIAAAWGRSPHCCSRSPDLATSWWRVSAPIAIASPSSRM